MGWARGGPGRPSPPSPGAPPGPAPRGRPGRQAAGTLWGEGGGGNRGRGGALVPSPQTPGCTGQGCARCWGAPAGMCTVLEGTGWVGGAGGHRHASPLPQRPASPQRFASVPRYVEMLVVADESMAQFHGAGLRRYLLTVLAAAARSFRHSSLGNAVELRVTRLVVLGQGTPGPPTTPNAAQMLRNFCQWQKGLNVPDEDSPLHFDTLGGCWGRSCAIVEDDGLQSAFTAAHELGEQREPTGRGGGGGAPGEMWSPCSAHFITDFLDNGHGMTQHRWSQCRGSQYPQGPLVQWCRVPAGQCLLDKPSEWLQLPSVLPGSIYPVLRQCQLAFGPDSRHCGDLQPPCASLWCTGRVSGRSVCQTKHFPWADGTPCAPGKVCMDGLCVGISHMQKLTVSPSGAAWGGWRGGHSPASTGV
uniref:ADAM metallopeptidase with thrombospondin type 1 motif 4 n=1 Tax=Aquila chrysaetos chrysaetos TaxID=223781 RepID=A0A663EML8_AQUCH